MSSSEGAFCIIFRQPRHYLGFSDIVLTHVTASDLNQLSSSDFFILFIAEWLLVVDALCCYWTREHEVTLQYVCAILCRRTPLHCAIEAGNVAVFNVLISDGGCDLELHDDAGFTALWLALSKSSSDVDNSVFANCLVAQGSSTNAVITRNGGLSSRFTHDIVNFSDAWLFNNVVLNKIVKPVVLFLDKDWLVPRLCDWNGTAEYGAPWNFITAVLLM